ncbi:hypothetical protein [uncultured Vibrio sp.]|nr:hypothetical protein [uncultured Vibrio sp.]
MSGQSGYIGMIAFKPLNDNGTALAVAGTTQGQNDLLRTGARRYELQFD